MKFSKIILLILTIYSGQLFAMSIVDVSCNIYREIGNAIASKVRYVALSYIVKMRDVLEENDEITFCVIYPDDENNKKDKPINKLEYKILHINPETRKENKIPLTFEPEENYIYDSKEVSTNIAQCAPRLLSRKEQKKIIELVNKYFSKNGHSNGCDLKPINEENFDTIL
jgi:predicted RNA-binding protein with RPS1 domain